MTNPTQTEAAEMEKAAKKFLIERGWSPRHSIIASDVFMMDMADFALSREREAVRNAKVAAPIGVCSRHLGKHSERIGYDPCLNYTAAPPESQSAEQLAIENLWRQVGLPEYFLGNGGTNHKLYSFAEAYSASQNAALTKELEHLNAHVIPSVAALTKERDELRKEIERLRTLAQEVIIKRTAWLEKHGVPISWQFAEFAEAIGNLTEAVAALDAGKEKA